MVAASDEDIEVGVEPGERGGRGSSDATGAAEAEHDHAPGPRGLALTMMPTAPILVRCQTANTMRREPPLVRDVSSPNLLSTLTEITGWRFGEAFHAACLHAGLGRTGGVEIFLAA
jgi:hypothetical protein